jgi:hypothetical protein
VTLLFLLTTNNSPDLIVYDHAHMALLGCFYVFTTLLNYFILRSILLAFINEAFTRVLLQDLDELDQLKQRDILRAVNHIHNYKDADYDHIEKIVMK